MSNKPWSSEQQAFQAAIKAMRKQAGLTQSELAAKLEKPQSYVSKFENGERRLDFVEVWHVCHQCESSIEDFTGLYEQSLRISGRV